MSLTLCRDAGTLRVNRKMYAAAAGILPAPLIWQIILSGKGCPLGGSCRCRAAGPGCIAEKRSLPELTVSELQVHSPLFTEEALPLLTPEAVVAARASRGTALRLWSSSCRKLNKPWQNKKSSHRSAGWDDFLLPLTLHNNLRFACLNFFCHFLQPGIR